MRWVPVALCAVMLGGNSVRAAWDVRPAAMQTFRGPDGAIDNALEASGVVAWDGSIFSVDDKTPTLAVSDSFGRETGRLTIPGDNRSKYEGLALDERTGTFYAIGAQDARPERSALVAFRLRRDGNSYTVDTASVRRYSVAEALARLGYGAGKDAGRVEGLAFRPAGRNGTIYVSLRWPSPPSRVFATELPDNPPAGENATALDLKPAFSFDAGATFGTPFRIGDITYSAQARGFFLAGSTETAENAYYTNKLWFVPEGATGTVQPELIWIFGEGNKAEGLCVTGTPESLDVTAVFDNDAAATHLPSRVQHIQLVNAP